MYTFKAIAITFLLSIVAGHGLTAGVFSYLSVSDVIHRVQSDVQARFTPAKPDNQRP